MQVINQIEKSINETYDIVIAHFNKQMIVTIEEEEEEQNDQQVVQYMCDDYKPIYNLSIYDVTNDYEIGYDFIQADNLEIDKRKYCEEQLDQYEFVYDTEHDPEKLLASGWQRIYGIAHVYNGYYRGKPYKEGTFYKTSPNSGIYVKDVTYSWFYDGSKCWLTQIPKLDDGLDHEHELETDYITDITFDYNYNLYIKLRCQGDRSGYETQVLNLHTRVAELQKELAELKRNNVSREPDSGPDNDNDININTLIHHMDQQIAMQRNLNELLKEQIADMNKIIKHQKEIIEKQDVIIDTLEGCPSHLEKK